MIAATIVLLCHTTRAGGRHVRSATWSHLAASELGASGDQIVDAAVVLAHSGLVKLGTQHLELVARIEDRLTIAELATWCARDRPQVMAVIYGAS